MDGWVYQKDGRTDKPLNLSVSACLYMSLSLRLSVCLFPSAFHPYMCLYYLSLPHLPHPHNISTTTSTYSLRRHLQLSHVHRRCPTAELTISVTSEVWSQPSAGNVKL